MMAGSESRIEFEAEQLAKDSEQVRESFWLKLKRVAAKLPFTEELLAAYYCAFDRKTPRHVQVTLLGALAYFILPFDFIPDMMPVLGFTDDAAVLATAIRMVSVMPPVLERSGCTKLLALSSISLMNSKRV